MRLLMLRKLSQYRPQATEQVEYDAREYPWEESAVDYAGGSEMQAAIWFLVAQQAEMARRRMQQVRSAFV